MNPTFSGAWDIESCSWCSWKWVRVTEVACVSGGTPS
jgi:hypothetical protein